MSKFKPLGDKVLVKPETKDEQKSKGGLILTDVFKEETKFMEKL